MSGLFALVSSSVARVSVAQAYKFIQRLSAIVLATLAFGSVPIYGQTATPPASATDFGSSAVGTAVTQTAVTFTVGSGGPMGTPLVLTQGTPNLDFTLGTASTCTGAVGSGTCIVNVIFKPRAPGQRMGAVELTNPTGKIVATAFVYGMGTGPAAMLAPGTIRTIAGGATLQTCPKATDPCGDGGSVSAAQFGEHGDVTVDAAGNLYIAERDLYRIRKVDVFTGNITTIAGTGNLCNSAGSSCGDDGPATSATLGYPGRVAVDGAGNVFIPDGSASSIRKVDAVTGVISNFASGFAGLFNGPDYVTIDAFGSLFACDRSRVYKVAAGTRTITAVAGPEGGYTGFNGDGQAATSAQLEPGGVAVDAAGNLYIADTTNNRIRKVTASSGLISTIAGSGAQGYDATQNGVPATSAALYNPRGMALDAAGDVYFSDTFNNVVRKVTAAGIITTVAGNGQKGFDLDTGTATAVKLYFPSGVAFDSTGNLLIHDDDNFRIRRVSASPTALAFASTNVGTASSDSPQTVTVGNSGNAPLTFAPPASGLNPSITAGYTLAASSTCPQLSFTGNPGVLAAGSSCTADVVFKPVAASQTNTGSLIFTDDSLNVAGSMQTVALSGISTGTTGIVTPTLNLTVPTTAALNATVGGTVQFFSSSTSAPTGNVMIYALAQGSTTPIALSAVASSTATNGSGAAFSFTAPATLGTYSIYASYAGDANFNSALSSNSTLTVSSAAKGTATLSVYAPAGEVSGTAITGTVSAVFSGNTATPTGSVVVTAVPTSGNANPSVVLGTFPAATLAAAGAPGVSLPYTAPAKGFYNVTATYVGDTNFNAATPAFSTINVSPAVATTTLTLTNPATGVANQPFATNLKINSTTITATPQLSYSILAFNAANPGGLSVVQSGSAAQLNTPAGANGTGLLRLTGTFMLIASYPGDSNIPALQATSAITIDRAASTLTVIAGTTSTLNVPYQVSVQLNNTSSGGCTATCNITVSAQLNGSTAPPVTQILDPKAAATGTVVFLTLPTVGTYTVTVSYTGDDYNQPATSPAITVVVAPPPPTNFTLKLEDPTIANHDTAISAGHPPSETAILLTAAGVGPGPATLSASNLQYNDYIVFRDAATMKIITSATPVAAGTHVLMDVGTGTVPVASLDLLSFPKTLPISLAGLLGVAFLGWRKRNARLRRSLYLLSAVCLIALSGAALAGCNDTYSQVVITATPVTPNAAAPPQSVAIWVVNVN